jgi:hypothetical protein
LYLQFLGFGAMRSAPNSGTQTATAWSAFPLFLIASCWQSTCDRSDWPDLSWWPPQLYIWTFGAGYCSPYTARLYLVSAGLCLLAYVAVSLACWARDGDRAFFAAAVFWGLVAHMMWGMG